MATLSRVNLSTYEVDKTPLPDFLSSTGVNQLVDLSWVPDQYHTPITRGYGWWPDYMDGPSAGMYEHVDWNTVTLVANLELKMVANIFAIVPWSPEEIAADKLQKFKAAGDIVAEALHTCETLAANKFGFFSTTNAMAYALSFLDSAVTEDADLAIELKAYRAQLRAISVVKVNEVLQTGIILEPAQYVALFPPAPDKPTVTLPVDPDPV